MREFFTFDNALEYFHGNPDFSCFAFYPTLKKGKPVGGTIFVLTQNEDDGEIDFYFQVDGGLFFSSVGEEDFLSVDEFDDVDIVNSYGIDPRTLLFKECTTKQALSASGMHTEFAVAILNGREDLIPASAEQVSPIWISFLHQHIPN